MKSLTDFFRHNKNRTWALVGKGPSFSRRHELRLAELPALGLNHVCLHHECRLYHFTDLDAYLQCSLELAGRDGAVVLPWHPHVRNKPGKRSLEELLEDCPTLDNLCMQGRLYSYNSTLAKKRKVGLSTHHTRYFSAVVGLDILAVHSGAGTVVTLGIDGGSSYSPEFSTETLLANGRDSFDAQFAEMKKISERYEVEVKPLWEYR